MVSKWHPVDGTGGGPASLRKVHRALVLRALFEQPGIARLELAGQLGLSAMAIGRIVRELEEAGLIGEANTPSGNGGRGRPASGLHLCPDGAYVAGAVISAFSQEVHLLNLRGESIASQSVKGVDLTNGPKAVELYCAAIKQLIVASGVACCRVAGAGFAVSANVDSSQGRVIGGGYLGWSAFDLAGPTQRSLGIPVTLNKLADALLRAEVFSGCASTTSAAVLIHCSTILGASFVANDSVVSGARFQAGRIGHFPTRATRLICSCGQSNCLNCTASGWSILNRLKLLESPSYEFDQIRQYSRLTRALVHNELSIEPKKTARILREAGDALAHGLRFIELTYDPDMIILAGPLGNHDAYYRSVLRSLQKSGSTSSDMVRKLTRGRFLPGRAAGLAALLDTVFTPSLNLSRLTGGHGLAKVTRGET